MEMPSNIHAPPTPRKITPSQLSLFSINPVIDACWEDLEALKPFEGSKPAVIELNRQLFADGLRHEQVLLNKLEKEGHWIGRVTGKLSGPQHHQGCDGRRGRLHP